MVESLDGLRIFRTTRYDWSHFHNDFGHVEDSARMEAFFMIIGCGVGAAVMAGFFPNFYRSLQRDNWEKVSGRLDRAVVEESKDADNSTQWAVRVEYQYTYGAIRRQGRESVRHSSYWSMNDARQCAAGYRANEPIDVYVYKNDPAHSRLKDGIDYGSLVAVIIGGCFFTFFLLFFLFKFVL